MQDIGGACVNLSTPNRTISEYDFTAVVRLTDPGTANDILSKRPKWKLQFAGWSIQPLYANL